MNLYFAVLKGKTLNSVIVAPDKESITFECNDGTGYMLYHSQDCCESVSVEDIIGDLKDLIGEPILDAREETNNESHPEGFDRGYAESFLWTFYLLRTIKGSVTIRWYGSSNGYYSESVSFVELRT